MGRLPDAVRDWQAQLTPVTVDGVRSFVLDTGMGDPVVFLHGIPTQAYLWRDVAQVVSHRWRVIAPDLLGFGFSDRPEDADYSPGGQASFIQRVLSELGVERYALVVHDYGALVGAELLTRDPDSVTNMVVLNTSFWEDDWSGSQLNPFSLLSLPGVGEVAFRVARKFMLREAFGLYVSERQRLTSDVMDVYWHPFTDGFADVLLRLFRDRAGRMDEQAFCRWRDAIEAFDRPSLVIWGDRDPTFRIWTGRRIAEILPAGNLELFEHSNHFVPEDRPEALGRLIKVLLSGRYKG
ncbi:MAG TPA: alpha/beta fold hydrolase [Thermomicrobiales bacterium]|nr:alpha/beta fold hydrolase [Thermomicrobiales bacterium]